MGADARANRTAIAVLASGSGTNLQAIIDQAEDGRLPAELRCVISDRPDAFALRRAERHGIPAFSIRPKDYADREAHERAVAGVLESHGVELVVLAGYMRLLTPTLIGRYRHRIINIHPALLPAFPGTRGYEDAWAYGVKVSGCTVHFVDEGCDTGPIILQAVNPVLEADTFESFRARGLAIEHEALPQAIRLFCAGRLAVEGRTVRIRPG